MSVYVGLLLLYLSNELAELLLGFLECLGGVFGGHHLFGVGFQLFALGKFVEGVAGYGNFCHVLHGFA